MKFEKWLWNQAEVDINHFHGDNGKFTADIFQRDCKKKGQLKSFYCVRAQHKNDKAERDIQIITNMASTFMVHFSLHLTYH